MNCPRLDILALSNLVWERGLFQRPQQLVTQFATLGCRVGYLARWSSRRWFKAPPAERSIQFAPRGWARNIPYLPLSGKSEIANGLSLQLVARHGREYGKNAPPGRRVLWLQNPDYEPLTQSLPHDLLVYDCMDPFHAFRQAAPWIARRETQLLSRADLLFTGGRSLHAEREGLHSNAHCFPSGIDFEHFARGAQQGPLPADIGSIRRPILGYFGAVDERLDWELLQSVCRARPLWSIVLIGPLIGFDQPPFQAPNFHCLGARPYDELPEYLRAFDVALIPWLVNGLTRCMSPTKTPEYLAAGRPVVSTPIPDVVADYGEWVRIAFSTDVYLEACEEAISQGTGPAYKPPQARSWHEMAEDMLNLMETELARKTRL